MLQLKKIVKDYTAGDSVVHALKGIDLQFRKSEFVAVLGHSGCGKTTLLNIIGGLDQYTSGDLVINGKSTRDFTDSDWDTYRNHSVGFVFQTYNLIPHQTVLSNVELALTLSGVSKAERRQRAKTALESVGLADQLYKKPNQMSGGQMQRVAIARALVNDPDILLADEPTGALDSETSVQVMEILKEISRDRLIVMVTHNPELAETYATRIVRVKDGEVVSDSDPYNAAEDEKTEKPIGKKPSMSFRTALGLSLNNLMTKKGRTFLTAFAGSIGIIGIALILSLSNGIQTYIDRVQEDTLSSYPITIEAERMDMTSLVTSMMGVNAAEEEGEGGPHEKDAVYSNTIMYDLINSLMQTEMQTNNLRDFKSYIDAGSALKEHTSAVKYSYDLNMNIYAKDVDGTIFKSDVTDLLQTAMGAMYGGDYSSYFAQFGASYSAMQVWEEMLPPQDGSEGLVNSLLTEQYDVIYGSWPKSYDEAVLIVNKDNEISDLVIYCMGLGSQEAVVETMEKMMNGEELDTFREHWSYEDICDMSFKIVLPAEYYQYDSLTGAYSDISTTDAGMDFLYNSDDVGTRVKIVGILRPNEDAVSTMLSGAIGYTSALTDYLINKTADMEILKKQKDDPDTDVILNLPFLTDDYSVSDEQKYADITAYLSDRPISEKAAAYIAVQSTPSEAYLDAIISQQMNGMTRELIESQVTGTYAAQMGVDAETVQSYISHMDDETLFSYVEDALRQQIAEQYAAGVETELGVLTTEQLAAFLDAALAAEPLSEEAAEAEAPAAPDFDLSALTPEQIMQLPPEQLALLPADVLAQLPPEMLMQLPPEQLALLPMDVLMQLPPEMLMQLQAMAPAQPEAPAEPEPPAGFTMEQFLWLYDNYMPATVSEGSYEGNLKLLGDVDLASPKTIHLYASTFADKDAIADAIEQYNDGVEEDDRIEYTDYVALLMSSITTIINAISYVLIAFVAISLVVSSIMIGIITYISVLERTKEIGILRAIGASKRDVSRVFNAETLIVGFCSGIIGIGVTLLLIIPINLIVHHLTDIQNLNAILPPQGAVILVIISMFLTFIAGLIPSGIAARKDPVEALRTE